MKHFKGDYNLCNIFIPVIMYIVLYAYFRYHNTLCLQSRVKDESHPLTQLNETWKQMHYPPETATVMLLARMVAMVNQTDLKLDLLSTFSQFCHRKFCVFCLNILRIK